MKEEVTIEKENNALAVVSQSNAATIFVKGDGIQDIIKEIRAQVAGFVPDTSTQAGRKEIASMAYKVARTKTYLDDMGKELVAKYKAVPKKIDANRKLIRDELDALRDEVREPLDRYEAEEAERIAALRNRMEVFDHAERMGALDGSIELRKRIESLESIVIDESWQEMTAQAGVSKDAALIHLRAALDAAIDREAKEAELAALREREREREQKDREEAAARQAAEKARKEAEDRAMREKVESQMREEAAKRQAAEAELRRQQAEESARLAAEQAERDKAAAIEQAKEDERKRIEAEEAKKAEEERRRAEDRDHRIKINVAALNALIELGLTEDQGKTVIRGIASGKIPHVNIAY